ncbi:hypothetical protein CBS101457_002455 [Exobasidium rhododendri]|nr:hypothetical protein CBS101457_002455 [Exobasidium rhododendri]
MAVSRTFVRGISSSFSSTLLRSSTPTVASSSRSAWPSTSYSPASGSQSFSTSTPAFRDDASTSKNIKIPREHVEKMMDDGDVGHDMTGGRVGKHSKRTLASFSMEEKVCVVTGAARGLGNLMARTFIESGSNTIAILDLSSEEAEKAALEAVEWFEEHGDVKKGVLNVIGLQCNVADEASVQKAMDQVHKHFGRIDVVVNSAGIVENFPAEEYPTPKLQKLIDINFNGSYYVAREAAKKMFADNIQGSIILVASMSASIVNYPQPQAPYNASKAAVKHLASSLAVEWAKRGIRVNSLSPGYMLTSLTRVMFEKSAHGAELRADWESKTPMGRMGQPEDLKGAAVYLASDASKYTTGTDLIVDGGYVVV